MSDAPQHADPDLHAIFGIGEGESASREPIIEVERVAPPDPDIARDPLPGLGERTDPIPAPAAAEPAAVFDTEPVVELTPAYDPDRDVESGEPPVRATTVEREEHEPEPPIEGDEWTGITRPSRRGSSQRFLTDVVVEMGLASREQVEEALEISRGLGTTAERGLIEKGALTQDGLARALAERYGLDHLDLGVFSVDMGAANLVTTTTAKRYQAVPVAFADKRTLLVAMADPANVLAVDDIAIMTGYEIRVAVAPPDDIVA